jgi:Spy/CpxP family protein refolding chaperone
MMLKRAFGMVTIIFTVLALTGPGMALGSSKWRWWQNDDIITQLNLSPDEIKLLDDAYVASRQRMIASKGRVDAERFKLEELLSRPEIDEAAVREQNRRMESARSDLAAVRFDFLLKSREILGYERFQKLTEIQRKWREERKNKWEQKQKEEENQGK